MQRTVLRPLQPGLAYTGGSRSATEVLPEEHVMGRAADLEYRAVKDQGMLPDRGRKQKRRGKAEKGWSVMRWTGLSP